MSKGKLPCARDKRILTKSNIKNTLKEMHVSYSILYILEKIVATCKVFYSDA